MHAARPASSGILFGSVLLLCPTLLIGQQRPDSIPATGARVRVWVGSIGPGWRSGTLGMTKSSYGECEGVQLVQAADVVLRGRHASTDIILIMAIDSVQ